MDDKQKKQTVVSEDSLSGLTEHEVRVEKIKQMQAQGINPWPASLPVSATAMDVIKTFGNGEQEKEYTVAGRVMSIRLHGKTAFAHLQDRTGTIQIYIKANIVGPDRFAWLKDYLDMGDFLWAKGTPFRTKTGEITLNITDFTLQSKCLHPLPDKFHGLADIETIYRQRYLDLITNPESRRRFAKRAQIIHEMRMFFQEHDYVEVETPMLHPIPGGAAARPFVTHHNALGDDFYLRIAPELYLKRLVVGGVERVFEINRNFRNEGISTRHNPEFTMVEWYTAHQNYHDAMNFVEAMLKRIAQSVCGSLEVPYGEHVLNFEHSFERIALKDSVSKYTAITPKELKADTIDATLKKYDVHVANQNASLGEKVYALFEELVEHQLIQPTFITDFPIEVSPLAKRDPDDSSIAARFELFIAGMELSNGFNELNDPFDQAERFKGQAEARQSGDDEAHYYDADYISALEYGLPPTVGVGIGVDRLAMLLTNATSIKDVILFPTLKKKAA